VTGVEVAVEVPALATVPFAVDGASPLGVPARGGLVVDVPVVRDEAGTVVITASMRGWGAAWNRAPAVTATVWNADLDAGYRVEGWSDRPVSAWWGVGAGLHGGLLAAGYWEEVLTFGVGGWTGGGIQFGAGAVRGALSVRASATLDVDAWNGSVMAHETTTWTYWPGSARVAVVGGVGFR
jgi:hypothetical protein